MSAPATARATAPTVSAEQHQFVGLGKLEWTALPPPHDLPLWLPALRAALASDGAELSCALPALSVRRSAVSSSNSAAQGPGGGVPTWPPCLGRGRFDQAAGVCQCRSGYGGDSCEQTVPQRCNDDRKRCVPGKVKPGMATTGSLGEKPSCMEWTRVLSRCSAQCDETLNRCVCGDRAVYPGRHMKMCEMKGINQLVRWRDPGWARFQIMKPWQIWSSANHTPLWFEEALGKERLEKLWDTPVARARTKEQRGLAWCDRSSSYRAGMRARRLGFPSCRCYDGRGGRVCELPWLAFCLNQCSGRGECRSGFCLCEPGWSGTDCSIPLVPPAPPAPLPLPSSGAGGAAGTSGTSGRLDWEPEALHDRARASPPLRPSVYVYELPAAFNTQLMETRFKRNDCTYRRYGERNSTKWESYAFGMELAVHEVLLASRHRTLDPETADFYFVPVYGGCYISRFFRPTPAHSLFVRDEWLPAPVLGNQFYRSALEWIQAHFPYWDRRGGADHIFAFPHDEGACIAPIEMRTSILLTSWGRHELHPRNSTTTMPEHKWWWPDFVPQMYASHRCFDPAKDILMPVFTKLTMLGTAAALERPGERQGDRNAPGDTPVVKGRHGWLFHFRGQVLHTVREQHYSFGIRQQAHRLFKGREAEGLLVSDQHSRLFMQELRNSTFCAVFPGNGWGHLEAPIIMGCIPVVVSDAILVPWENVLDFSSFGLRIPRAELPRLPQILRAIPEARVRQLQRGLVAVWERFTYSSLALAAAGRRRCDPQGEEDSQSAEEGEGRVITEGCAPNEPGFVSDPRLTGRDAIDTMMQVLKLRLAQRSQAAGEQSLGTSATGSSAADGPEQWGKRTGRGARRAKRRAERVRPWRERQAEEAERLLRQRKALLAQQGGGGGSSRSLNRQELQGQRV
eukprot:scaffold10351_cov62-Phaeocystis_antarctica.AAC.15